MEQNKFDLAIGVALIPVLGTGLVLINQVGRFLFYGIPLELLELDAYKVLVSGVSMLLIGLALVYTGATLHSLAGTRWWERLAFNLGFAVILTASFWAKDLHWGWSVSWATVVFVGFVGGVFYAVERWLRRHAPSSAQERIAGWALVASLSCGLLLVAALAFGVVAERDRTLFSFISHTNDAVVAKSGDLLIVKTYDSDRHEFDHEQTKLVTIDGQVILESRTVPRRK
jgi:hypothetical protein